MSDCTEMTCPQHGPANRRAREVTDADRERAADELAFLRSLTDPMTGRVRQDGAR